MFRGWVIFLFDLTISMFWQCFMVHAWLLPLFFHTLKILTANSRRKMEKERARLLSHEFRERPVLSLFILFPERASGPGRGFGKSN